MPTAPTPSEPEHPPPESAGPRPLHGDPSLIDQGPHEMRSPSEDLTELLRRAGPGIADLPAGLLLDGAIRLRVGDVRGAGYFHALELVKDKATRTRYEGKGVGMICRQFCFDNGLIMRAVGDTMIIAPPLVISRDEIDELIEKARKCLDLTLEALI